MGSPQPGQIIEAAIALLGALIRGDSPDPEKALAQVGQGLSLLNELSRCLPVEAPCQGDVDGFLRKSAALAAPKVSDAEKAAPPQIEPHIEPQIEEIDHASDLAQAGGQVGPKAKAAPETAPEGDPDTEPAPDAEALTEPDAASKPGGGQKRFKPRKKGSGVAYIVPTPTQVRRDVLLSSQKLTVDYFKADFTAALEDLQMKLVSVEQKSDPVAAILDTLSGFKIILGGLSLLDLDNLARLVADTIGLIDYVVH